MSDVQLFARFGVALLLGLMVGLQREHAASAKEPGPKKRFAGVRTFPLIGLAGCAAAFAAQILDEPLVFLGIAFAVALLIAVSYALSAARGAVGMTTEMAAIVVLLVGAFCYWDYIALAAALAVVTTGLLTFKTELGVFVRRISREDMIAALKFFAITAIILPVVPDHSLVGAPYDVVSPRQVWLMVVLISAIGFLGYVLIKIVGAHRGIVLTGVLGGLVSSTATTLSFAQLSRERDAPMRAYGLAIVLAWAVMFGRILVEVGAVHRPLLGVVWLPITGAALIGAGCALYLFLGSPRSRGHALELRNPFHLMPAIQFGLLYGVIILVARVAQVHLGDAGIYLSSALSGVADVDAITLSMAELSRGGKVEGETAARAIVLAAMANTVVKGGIVALLGSAALRRVLAPAVVLLLAAGIGLAFLT